MGDRSLGLLKDSPLVPETIEVASWTVSVFMFIPTEARYCLDFTLDDTTPEVLHVALYLVEGERLLSERVLAFFWGPLTERKATSFTPSLY